MSKKMSKSMKTKNETDNLVRSDFPDDFVWGAATAAFQIEGANQTDGRGMSVWDTFCRQPGKIADGSDGSVACDHYHRWAEDLDLAQGLGLDAYRFSLAWPRLQPDGHGAWNQPGWDFYDRLIDGVLARGMQPFATLFHWDLPQALQDRGGWGNRDTCYRFADYADQVALRFGDRLASLTTHNEPWVVATLGHEAGIFAPGLKNRKLAIQVSHHLLLSHGLALRAIRARRGKALPVGIVLNQSPAFPATNLPADQKRADLEYSLFVRWYMEPLLQGAYPSDAIAHLGADAPRVESGDMKIISDRVDYLGINYYTRQIVSAAKGFRQPVELGLPVTDMAWEVYPEGLSLLLKNLHRDYRLPPLYITENGAAFKDQLLASRVHDPERTEYLKQHMAAVLDARRAGVDVRGYFVWSLLDNFEWSSGYAKRFGIVHVDYATQQRTLKDSALWYRSFLEGKR
jgi:beta-glucosidase